MMPDIPDVIFRFVTVRNPRKPKQDEVDTGFIFYNDLLQAPLIEQVAGLKGQPQGRLKMRAAARQYEQTAAFIGDPAALRKLSPQLADFADELSDNADVLTRDLLKQAAPLPEVGPDIERALWDSLLAYTLAGGKPEGREAVIWALRAINLLSQTKDKVSDAVLPRIATATVLLPSSVQIDPTASSAAAPANPPAEGEGGPPAEPAPAPAEQDPLAAYQAAHEEIAAAYSAELEKARAAVPEPPQVPKTEGGCITQIPEPVQGPVTHITALNQEVLGGLSEPTQQVLAALKVDPGARVPFVLNTIEEAATSSAQAAPASASALTRVVYAGGSIWSYQASSPRAISPGPADDRRIDIEYSGMYDQDQCRVKPLGIADFRRVEQQLWCYQPGEVAHIENVLIGETKERKTRLLRRSESILTLETTTETTKERDTQTTDRFEIQKETDKVVKDDLSFDLGVQVTAQYGTVKIQADTKFAVSHSSSESDKDASKYAKEVTDRSLERVVKRVREEQIQKLLEEYEETNTHGLDNKGGAAHIVGLYRWVDKIYQAKIVNYGKRLMFEFLVPEPAAFHLFALSQAPTESNLTVDKPIDPRSADVSAVIHLPPLKSHKDITVWNYAIWASAYDAKVDPPPPWFDVVSKSYNRDGLDQSVQFSVSNNDLKIPDGYEATQFFAGFGLHSENHDGGDNWITVLVGQRSHFSTTGGSFSGALSGEDDVVPVTVMGRTRMYGLDIEVTCRRRPETFEAWQIKTFDAVIKGYDDKYAAYQTALAEAKSQAASQIRGTNPLLNRQTEQLELKKSCIRLLDPHCNPIASEAMHDKGDCGYPEFDCCQAISDGSYVQFVEQAFEWSLITYLFYPYFWGRKCNWSKVYQLNDDDPLFLGFLQAGYARVVVPVRPGYEAALLRFLVDGQPWNGGSAPGVDSPLFVSIANEMKEPVGQVDPNVPPWFIRVPTTLTVLQCDSGCVPGQGLPCPQGQEQA